MMKPTRQEIIDTIYHLIITAESDPAAKLRNPETGAHYPVYRGVGGGCAIGRVLPDSLYRPEMELNSIRLLWRDREEIREYFSEAGVEFLQDIQQEYDNASIDNSFKVYEKDVFLENFRKALIEIVEKWRLRVPADLPRTNRLMEIIDVANAETLRGEGAHAERRQAVDQLEPVR